MHELDASAVQRLLEELSVQLGTMDAHAQLFIVGGAAMALAYDRDRVTRDVDAVFNSSSEVRRAVAGIADEHGLEPDWLNDAAKGFLPGTDQNPRTVFESDSLLVQVASPEYLLAMKLHASRDETDLNDAATLFRMLGYSTARQVIEVLTSVYPENQLLPRHYYIAEEVARKSAGLTPSALLDEPPGSGMTF